MHDEERQLREDLRALARSGRGRQLLQLGLRGIERGERNVTAGCWVKRGDAGCLFQHAYWEGVHEGVFADQGRPGDWIGSFVGSHDYGIVIRAIDSFDRLARSAFSDHESRPLRPRRARLRQDEWNTEVERLLVEILNEAQGRSPIEAREVGASV
jgi:hypothetical protein